MKQRFQEILFGAQTFISTRLFSYLLGCSNFDFDKTIFLPVKGAQTFTSTRSDDSRDTVVARVIVGPTISRTLSSKTTTILTTTKNKNKKQ